MGNSALQTVAQVTAGGVASFANGELVRLSGNKTATKAQGDSVANYTGMLGPVQLSGSIAPGGSLNVVTGGIAKVLLETGLTPAFGELIYPSASTAGRGTIVQPGGAPPIAVVFDASGYSSSTPYVLAMVIPAAALPNQPVANWTGIRYYFVDNENGDDGNIGYIDSPTATTFTQAQGLAVALKTSEELRNRLPRIGASRSVVVLYKPRSDNGNYVNKAGTNDYLDNNYSGYLVRIFRGSDFTNSTNDQVDCGGYTDATTTGPNADGSWTVTGALAGFTATVAAGTLPAENDLCGYKLEFKGNITSGARANGNVVAARLSNTTFDFGNTETIANGDEFYFRRPGVKFTSLLGHGGVDGPMIVTAGKGSNLIGFEFTTGTQQVWLVGRTCFQFCRFATNMLLRLNGGQAGISAFYLDESGGIRNIRCGVDFRGTASIDAAGADIGTVQYSAFHSTSTFQNATAMDVGGGCFFNSAATCANVASASRNTFAGGFALFGSTSATRRAARIITGITCEGVKMMVTRTDLSGAANGFIVNGEFNSINFENVTGNPTGYVVNVAGSRKGRFIFQTTVTSTGSPDLTLPGSVSAAIAGLTTTNIVDSAGNDIEGSAGHIVDSCVLVSNQSGGALAVGDVVRSNGTTNQVTSAQADAAANAIVHGVMVTAPANAAAGYMAVAGPVVANFDAAPTIGGIAYLSTGTARRLTTTTPAVAGTNQKLRAGRVLNVVSGNLARVMWHPENLAVTADGNP